MNEFNHRILALLKQQQERPEKFRHERGIRTLTSAMIKFIHSNLYFKCMKILVFTRHHLSLHLRAYNRPT